MSKMLQATRSRLNIVYVCALLLLLPCDTCSMIDTTHPHSECRTHKIVHRIEHADCETRRLLSFACRGQCESYTQYSTELRGIERYCRCCQATGKVVRRIRMWCRGENDIGPRVHIMQLMLPTGCMCRPCSGLSNVPDVVNPLDMSPVYDQSTKATYAR